MAEDRKDDDDLDVGDLRSVFASMREADEDPPDTGMAALMAAARTKADEMRPQPSWWERLAATLRRPAVLAVASVAILASGAVLVVNRGGGESKMTAAPDTTSIELREAADVRGPRETTAETMIEEEASEKGGSDPAAAIDDRQAAPSAGVPQPAPIPPRRARETRPVADEPPVDREIVRPHGEANAPEPSPPAAPVARDVSASSNGDVTAQTAAPGAFGAAQIADTPVASLVKQAERASGAGNCDEVRRIAAVVAERDQAAYKRAFGDGTLVRDCLAKQKR